MEIYEYDIHSLSPAGNYWKGTVNALRYDAISGAGSGVTDYITFSAKKGVYKASIETAAPAVGTDLSASPVTLSSDTQNCTVGEYSFDHNAQTGAYTLTLTLVPSDGYEFTTVSDVLAGVTVNGTAPDTAEVTADGCAVITKEMFTLIKADTDSDVPTLCVTFEKPVKNAALLLAFYDADGRVTGTVVRQNMTLPEQKLYVAENSTAASVKAFVFESMETLRPLGTATVLSK